MLICCAHQLVNILSFPTITMSGSAGTSRATPSLFVRLQAKQTIVDNFSTAPIATNEGKYPTPAAKAAINQLETYLKTVGTPLEAEVLPEPTDAAAKITAAAETNMSILLSPNCQMEKTLTSTFGPTAKEIQADKDKYGCESFSEARVERARIIDGRNQFLGLKEGVIVILGNIFGQEVVQLITCDDDGTEKEIDEYSVYDVVLKIYNQAIAPTATECSMQYYQALSFKINWRHPFAHNYAALVHQNQQRTASYGCPLHANVIMLILRPQIVAASQQLWGQCLAEGVREINNTYPVTEEIDDDDLADIVDIVNKFDAQRDLQQAGTIDAVSPFATPAAPSIHKEMAASVADATADRIMTTLMGHGFNSTSAFEDDDAYSTEDEENAFEASSLVSGLTKGSAASKATLDRQIAEATAILEKKKAEKKKKRTATTAKTPGDASTAATTTTGNGCKHCAFLELTNPHPPNVTPATCRANPANFADSKEWVIERYLRYKQAQTADS